MGNLMTNAQEISFSDDVAETIFSYLRERFPALSDCDANTPLLENGVLDSLGFLELMMFLSERFGIELTDGDFDPSVLGTPGQLADFVRQASR